MEDIFGIPESEKERKQRVLRENRRKGEAGEELIRMHCILRRGSEVERTGKGSDFHEVKRDLLGRTIYSSDIEVKTGKSRLSELQEKTKKKKRGHYRVERVEPPPFFYQDP